MTKRIGIISDTHGCWDEKYETYLGECDEIWHAGDIGTMEVADRFEAMRPVFRAVCGNCDELLRFRCEEADVLLKHIGGYPGHYDPSVRAKLYYSPPHLFVAGHSHILKVQYDKTLQMLHINPGAAGMQGWHKDRTLVRLTVEGNKFGDCEVITLNNNHSTT